MKIGAFNHITVIGLGLMGGAFAKALSKHTDAKISAIDQNPDALQIAKDKNWIAEGFTSLSNCPQTTDLVILATPASVLPELLTSLQVHFKKMPLILDISSVKTTILKHVQNSDLKTFFMSCHPMVGSEKGGVLAAENLSFFNKTCLLLNDYYSPELKTLLSGLGFHCVKIDADKHDRYLAASSHFPYLMACLTSRVLERQGYDQEINQAIIGSGFLDTTRISQSEIHWGLDVCLENKSALKDLLQTLKNEIEHLELALDSPQDLKQLLSTIKTFRAGLQ